MRKVTIGGDDGTDRVGELMLQLDWRDDSGGEMKTIVAGYDQQKLGRSLQKNETITVDVP